MKELALHILDIAQNSIRAASGEIRISVTESSAEDLFTVIISDNGSGMDSETLQKSTDPYFTTRKTRKVGLGLSLLAMNASNAGGEMKITSSTGMGTTVCATFRDSHIDRPPLGDIGGTISLLLSANPTINIFYTHTINGHCWSISTQETKEALGEGSITDLIVMKYLREMIRENISELTNVEAGHDKN